MNIAVTLIASGRDNDLSWASDLPMQPLFLFCAIVRAKMMPKTEIDYARSIASLSKDSTCRSIGVDEVGLDQ